MEEEVEQNEVLRLGVLLGVPATGCRGGMGYIPNAKYVKGHIVLCLSDANIIPLCCSAVNTIKYAGKENEGNDIRAQPVSTRNL